MRAISVTLRSTATPEEKLDRAEKQHQHDRNDHGEFDRRDAAAIIGRSTRRRAARDATSSDIDFIMML